MLTPLSTGILLLVFGAVIIGTVLLSAALASRRRRLTFGAEELAIPVNLSSVNDAVLVAGLGGQIVFANDVARRWFSVDGGEPDLWWLAQRINPPEPFLELFATEGQAELQLDSRTLEASSHRVAVGDSSQFIVVLREEAPLPSLDREERGSTRALQVLGEVTQNITASLDFGTTLDATLEGVMRLVPYDAAQIALWDQEHEYLHPRRRVGPDGFTAATHSEDETISMGEGYAGYVARQRRALLVEDVARFGEAQPIDRPTYPPYQSYIGIPLTVRNRFIGTLEIFGENADQFDREDRAIMSLLAEQAAIAIDNARQYSQQAERVIELAGLQQIAQAISVLRDPYDLFGELGKRIAELMGTEMGGVLLHDPELEQLVAQKPIHGVPDQLTSDYRISLEAGSPARSLWEDVNFWFSNDVPNDRLVEEMGLGMMVEMTGVNQTAMAAMTVGEDRVGVLQVSNKLNRAPFTMDDIRLLQTYADQAAIVVESARLYGEEQNRVAELQGLQQITQALSAFTNPDELYAQLTERIAGLMDVGVCGILIHEPENELLAARTPFYGMDVEVAEEYAISLKRGPARELWREYDLWESNQVLADDRIDALGIRDVAREGNLRTLLFAPLNAGGRRFGLLQVSNKNDGTDFDDGDKRLVAIFAGQAAALIDNARLYQDTDETLRRRAAELRSVSRISSELNATLELERILQVIAAEALRAEGARWGNLVMFDQANLATELIPTMRFGSDVGEEAVILERAAARSGETLAIDDFKKLPHYPSPLPDARSALLVPIHFENKVVGVLSLYSDVQGGLSANASEYAQALSSQATIAVTNATRHAEQVERSELLRRRAEQLTQIFELSRVFSSDQSLNESLEAVAGAVHEGAGFDVVLISVLDPGERTLRHVAHAGLSPNTAETASEKVIDWDNIERYVSDDYRISSSYLIPHTDSKHLIAELGLAGTTGPLEGEPGKWQPGDVLLIPLRTTGGELVGLLTVDQPRDRVVPSRSAVELLEIFANQAAIIVENSRLYRSVEERAEELSSSLDTLEESYEELDRLSQEMIRKDMELSQANDLLNLRAQRLLALHRVMESVDTSRRPRTVMRNIAEAVLNEMDIDQCIIALSDQTISETNGYPSDLAVIAAVGDLPDDLDRAALTSEDSVLSAAYLGNVPVIFAAGTKYDTGLDIARMMGTQTFVALPLNLSQGGGVLMVGSTRPGAAFDEDDRDLFALLASQVAVEYENARLYDAIQSEAVVATGERDQLQQLHVITTALQQTRELEERLQIIARGIRSVGWNKVKVMLVDPITMEAEQQVSVGYEENGDSAGRAEMVDGSIWQRRFEDQEFMSLRIGSSYFLPIEHPWVQSHVVDAPEPDPDADLEEWQSADQLYVPMYAGNEIIGLINLRDPEDQQRPTPASLRPLELFVQQAASALENTRLYQQTLQLHSFNEAVVQSIQQGIIVTDLEGTVESINSFLAQEYGWNQSIVGEVLFDAVPTLDELGFAEDFDQVVSTSQRVERTGVSYPVLDEVRMVNVYLYPRFNDAREVTGVVTLMEDVTDRARLEADIAQQGQQLTALSDISREITAMLSVDDMVRTTLEHSGKIIMHDQAAIWLRSLEGDHMEVVGARGFENDTKMLGTTVAIDDSPLFAGLVESLQPVMENQRTAENGDTPPMRSLLAAPMLSGRILVGAIVFEKAEAHAYRPTDGQVAAAFANQAAIALDNARLFEEAAERASELSRRTRRLSLLNRVSTTLGTALDVNSILQSVIDELVDALGAQQGSVFLIEEGSDEAKLATQSPSKPDGSVPDIRIPVTDNAAIAELNERRAPVAITDVRGSDDGLTPALIEREARSALVLPLVVANNLMGLMTIETTDDINVFDSDQIELAQTILNQTSVAVQNAQLFQETVARRAELGILLEAARTASSSLDLETVVENSARYFVRLLQADGCLISVLTPGQALATVIDYRKDGPKEDTPSDARDTLTDFPLTAEIINARNIEAISSDDSRLSVAEATRLGEQGMETVLMLPLIARDQPIGLIEVWSTGPREFAFRETELARALAASVATATENARLHDETQRRVQELATINDLSRALTQTISTEDLFEMLATHIRTVVETESLTVAQRDPVSGMLTFPLVIRSNARAEIEEIGYGADLYSYVIETQEPLIISRDVEDRLLEIGVDHIEDGLQSFVAVPLIAGEKVIGVLAVEDYDTPGGFDETDLRVLGPIAAQVAVSIENTRLYAELEQRLSETTTLQEVSRVVNSALDLREIFERVVSQLAVAFDYPLIAIFTVSGSELVLEAQAGYEAEEVNRFNRMPVETGIVGRAAMKGEPQHIRDVTRDPDYLPVKGWVRSQIAVPIVSDNEVLGALSVSSGPDQPLDENDMNLLRTFAAQVGTAVANARLFGQMVDLSEELERRVEERTIQLREERDRIDTLYRIAVELTASLDLDLVLNRALQLVGEAVGAEHGSLFLIDPLSDQLIWRAVMRGEEILPPGGRQIEMTRHEGMAGWVMDNRQSVRVDNVHDDPRWHDAPGTEHNRSLLGAPLIANEEVLGCIFFTSDQLASFNEGHVRLVEAAATQVANSINNAELYRLIRDQAERLGIMLRSQQTEAAKSQAILESVADGVMVSDQSGEIILFNAAAERIIELRRSEVLGRAAAELSGIYGAGAEEWSEILSRWSADPFAHAGEYISQQLEIGNKVVAVSISPVLHGGEYLGVVSVFRDITREVAADRIKSEFVATVSHELRTPMTSIKGYADLLLLGAAGSITDEQRKFLEIVKNNADRLSLLVNDLLDISRIEQGGLELDVRQIDLREIVQDVIETVIARYPGENGDSRIDFHVEMPDDVPELYADYDRVTQIVQNLVSNAYNYSDNGKDVWVRLIPDSDGVTVEVQDEGIGIPLAEQSRLFERFYRGDHPLVMGVAGAGLGLAIVQQLVKMHRGQIGFESEEGKGSTFRVWLPYLMGRS